MATQFSSDLKSLTTRMIAAGVKILHHVSLVSVALFLLVGAAHAQAGPCPVGQPCVLVGDITTHQVEVWPDEGNINNGMQVINPCFLHPSTGCTGTGGGGGEGLSCIAGSTSALYTVDNSGNVYTFNLTTGAYISTFSANASFDAIAVNGNGQIVYAINDNGNPGIYSLNPSSSGVTLGTNTAYPYSGNLALGNGDCAPNVLCNYDGNVFVSDDAASNRGIAEFMAAPNANTMLPVPPTQVLPGIPPNGGSSCATFGAAGSHCWSNPSGMAFDSYGNLWVSNNNNVNDTGTFEFAPGGTCGALLCPLNYAANPDGPAAFPVGVTVAPLNDPTNPGYVMVVNYQTRNIYKINPIPCTGRIIPGGTWTLGTCTESLFITDELGQPKTITYPQACPNPDNNGYVEICKQSNPEYPPPNQLYDFTVNAPLFSSGTIQVPLGNCSGAVEVPSGQVTVTEAPTVGVLVSDVTACSYNQFGQCVPDLISWTLPNLFATVPVAPGDSSLETLATFTNYAASPGQLKVCKIAGLGTPVGGGIEYTFNVTGAPPFQLEAGPADQGGFCQLVAGTFPVNTPVTIAETLNASYPLTNATVECNACTYSINLPQYSVTTTIGAGITVASFTNTKKNNGCLICRVPGTE